MPVDPSNDAVFDFGLHRPGEPGSTRASFSTEPASSFPRPTARPTSADRMAALWSFVWQKARLGRRGADPGSASAGGRRRPRQIVVVVGLCVALGLGMAATAFARSRRPATTSPAASSALPFTAAMSLPVAVGVPSSAVITPESVGAPATSAPGPIPRSAAPGPVIVAPTMVIHAAGAVAAPGIYRLPDPARVDDVVTAAGGLATDADQDALNLAARVADGERIFVPHKGQVPPSVVVGGSPSVALVGVANAPTGPGAAGAATAVVVDLNTASAEQLDSLPGVGPAIASRILERRATLGRFRSVSQLLDVPGIGDAKLAMLKNKVKV